HVVFAGGIVGDGGHALLVEHPGNAARLSQVATSLAKGVPDFGDGPVTVVGHRLHHHGDTAGAVALVADFIVVRAFEFPAAALDRALDVLLRHGALTGFLHRQPPPEVGVRLRRALPSRHD